jgi:DNA-binding NtrC family response regulator/predicted hydrocarbon binding protein
MKSKDISLWELIDVDASTGRIFLNHQRMVIQSAEAMGLLRREMIRTVGVDLTRRLLKRCGYAHGYEDSRASGERYQNTVDNQLESVRTTTRIHTILGIVNVEVTDLTPLPGGGLRTAMIWRDSFEAEEHLRHFGKSDDPVCWSEVGYASGSRSASLGRDFYYKEVMCIAKGDPYCKVEGRDAASWGDELPEIEADFVGSGSAASPAELRAELDRLRAITCEQNQLLRRYERQIVTPDAQSDAIRAQIASLNDMHKYIVRSPRMSEVVEQAMRIAPLQIPVLVQGESGTGKEFIANFIHQQSTRSAEPLVSVNCAALSETLLESELFGHVRGAFTGACRDKMGLFEVARNGTLFLDEIGEMPLCLQAKLLRTLENGEIRRVGGEHNIFVHPRIVAATNLDLSSLVGSGKFRSDLFFRLAGFVIGLPPLRERTEEIPPLAYEYMRRAASTLGRSVDSIRPNAMARLMHYAWPGNIRELKHAIERAVIVTRDNTIDLASLPREITNSGDATEEPFDLKNQERQLILGAFDRYQGNRVLMAKALNISQATLWRKMRRYRMEAGDGLPAGATQTVQ